MTRLSVLRNYPVICKNKRIGLLQSVSMDSAQKRVVALIVSCGFRGKRIISSENVLSIADGFILADHAARYKRPKDLEHWPLIRNSNGMLAGRVIDYAIDESTLAVRAIEMVPGYLPFEYKRKIWVYEYSRLNEESCEIVIPAGLCIEPTPPKGGEWECGFQP